MILQERHGQLLFFRQTDHALLSGAFATAWGNDEVSAPARREQTLVAASRHDDGWAEWELEPKLRDDGQPVDFIRVPVCDHVPLYKRGIDLVEHENPYAGLVASLHGQRLYTRPFHPGMDPRIEHLKGADLDLARAYVDGEHERQMRLTEELGSDVGTDAEEDWRRLQVWDRLSLLVCMNPITAAVDQTLPAIASNHGDVRITARGTSDGVLTLDPYPFTDDGAEFDIVLTRTARTSWPDEASFRRDFRAGAHETLGFRCVRA
jgi:hypothetical protein